MKPSKPTLILLAIALLLLGSGCSTPAGEPAAAAAENFFCPVTLAPDPHFVPPEPWPDRPPDGDRFWYGGPGLWTALPHDGRWGQLARGEKFWWWSEAFDVNEDDTPNLTLTARRLDEPQDPAVFDRATNGYHESFHWAMLSGVTLPSPGCWEITGEYRGEVLTLVVQVPEE